MVSVIKIMIGKYEEFPDRRAEVRKPHADNQNNIY